MTKWDGEKSERNNNKQGKGVGGIRKIEGSLSVYVYNCGLKKDLRILDRCACRCRDNVTCEPPDNQRLEESTANQKVDTSTWTHRRMVVHLAQNLKLQRPDLKKRHKILRPL